MIDWGGGKGRERKGGVGKKKSEALLQIFVKRYIYICIHVCM